MWQKPQQGAPGLSQGQMTPAQVPCPRQLEGQVCTSGVTPDMHLCTVAPLSRWSSLQGSLFPCNLLQILLQLPPLDRLGLEPLAGHQGPELWLHGHRVHHRPVQIWAMPWPSAPLQPGKPPSLQCREWGLQLATRQLQENLSPPVPPSQSLGPEFSEPSPCPSDAGVCHGAVAALPWERAGNAPCSPVPVGFSCCASL